MYFFFRKGFFLILNKSVPRDVLMDKSTLTIDFIDQHYKGIGATLAWYCLLYVHLLSIDRLD